MTPKKYLPIGVSITHNKQIASLLLLTTLYSLIMSPESKTKHQPVIRHPAARVLTTHNKQTASFLSTAFKSLLIYIKITWLNKSVKKVFQDQKSVKKFRRSHKKQTNLISSTTKAPYSENRNFKNWNQLKNKLRLIKAVSRSGQPVP